MRIRPALLVLPTAAWLSGCSGTSDGIPTQEPAAVTQLFKDLIGTCSAPLHDNAAIDQSAIAAAGWKVSKRAVLAIMTNKETTYSADAYPALKAGDLEMTEWSLPGTPILLHLDRYGANDEMPDYGRCAAHADVGDRKVAESVVASVQAHFGRPPDRVGDISMGGDSASIVPRRNPEKRGYYWQLAQHDVYVITDRDGLAKLEVVAMPDRSKLDQYSDDRPEIRLYIPDETSQAVIGTQQASEGAN